MRNLSNLTSDDAPAAAQATTGHLPEVAGLFLRLGFTAFGGPAAHIAMMRDEVVRRRGWLSDERFLDLMGAVNLIPGPNSTELAIYLGYLRAGWPGLLVAGACFIGPAMGIVLALAWAYVALGATPAAGWLLYGIKPVVIAIIVVALLGLGRVALRSTTALIFAALVLVAYLLGGNELVLLFGAGALFAVVRWLLERRNVPPSASGAAGGLAAGVGRIVRSPAALATTTSATATSVAVASFSQLTLFLTFLKIGAVLYGSGYVLLAFLRDDFVLRLHWLTDRQLLDAISIGQFTPGPVFTTATFIGYVLGGLPGALLATLGIFLPSFAFIPLLHRLAGAMRRSRWTGAILTGVNVAAVALMAGVTAQLARAALVDVVTVGLAGASFVVLWRFKPNSAWLIAAGALVGLVAKGL